MQSLQASNHLYKNRPNLLFCHEGLLLGAVQNHVHEITSISEFHYNAEAARGVFKEAFFV
jgi:hypothetical protein